MAKSNILSTISAAVLLGTLPGITNADGIKLLQTAEMVELPSLQAVGGGGVLKRAKQEVSARLSTGGLDTDAAYSVWWVIFNRPGHCSDVPCSVEDLENEAVGGAVFYADGFITGADGTANVTADLEAGPLPIGTDMLIPGVLRRGNGFGAEIHLVIRTHGPISPGSVGQQTTTFDAECGVCMDQQAAVFPAVF